MSIGSTTYSPAGDRESLAIDWTPYLIGAGIGVLSWVVFVVVNTPLGITTALSQVAGGAATPILGAETVARNSYWARNAFVLDYGTLFLVGTLIGGFLSAVLSGRFRFEQVPTVWAERFGPSPARRYAVAFLGGAIAMYGARLANGCTSGNGISGGLQLALSGWVFLAVMFATGIVTAFALYRPASR
ncbi:YeeE/YedE thiosulfate transporter family protein [Phreatobacter sp.]|uniref:YeeE/YedE thiosulfate transporter family protein n=1 Tax=Phreatobacter sp. TaxID=1966341 RepID=UPI003F704D6D